MTEYMRIRNLLKSRDAQFGNHNTKKGPGRKHMNGYFGITKAERKRMEREEEELERKERE